MIVARQLAWFVVNSARLGSARLNFFTSWADILARFINESTWFVNEPAPKLNELYVTINEHVICMCDVYGL
jgi:hypothetical protein